MQQSNGMMTRDLDGPWLTLAETSQKTGCVKNEILYSIQDGGVTPVIFTHNRPFEQRDIATNGVTIGHAVFRYSGPLGVDKTVVDEIIAQDRTIIGQRPVSLLRPGNIFDWNSAYPFEGKAPNGFLSHWEPRPEIDTGLVNDAVLHLPQEHPDYEWAESSLVEHVPENYDEDEFFERYANQYLIRSPVAKYVYGTNCNSVYSQQDLRLPASSIPLLGVLTNNHEQKETNTNKLELPTKQRSNDLHLVIIRVLEKYPDAKSGLLWNALRRDSQSTRREFDFDELITQMDNATIYWANSQSAKQTLKKRTFQNLVSKFRQQLGSRTSR